MTKTVNFYGCVLVFAFMCSVCGSLFVTLPLFVLWIYLLLKVRSDFKNSSKEEIMRFTGAQWFKDNIGIDLFGEE